MNDPRRVARLSEPMLLTSCALLSLYLLANLIGYRYGRDQGIFAVVAHAITDGGAPYRDAWDFKTPGIYFVFVVARVVFGRTEHGVRALEALAFASLFPAFVILARRAIGDGRAGVIAATVAIVTHVQLEFWHTAQPESFAAVAIAWALVCGTHVTDHWKKQRWIWFAMGVLYGVSALLKPTLGGGVAVSVGFILARTARRRWAMAIVEPVLGFALPIVVTLVWLARKHALDDAGQALFVFAPQYTRLSTSEHALPISFAIACFQWATKFSLYTPVGLVALAALPKLCPATRTFSLHVLGVTATILFGVALQGKFFDYHYGAALPLGALLAGLGLYKGWRYVRESIVAVAAIAIALILSRDLRTAMRSLPGSFWDRTTLRARAAFHADERVAIEDELSTIGDVDAAKNRRLAEALRARTPSGSRVFLFGFEPSVYELAGRAPASRFIYDVPQRVPWQREQARAQMIDELRASSPSAIAVEHGDVFPFVTGDDRDSATTALDFPAFQAMLSERYRLVQRDEKFDLYLAQ